MFFVTPNLKYNIQLCIYTVMFTLITIIFHAKCLARYCVRGRDTMSKVGGFGVHEVHYIHSF